ncbi:MAG: hypothetical protein ACQ9MH_03495 [Nitrospinales bacterium]
MREDISKFANSGKEYSAEEVFLQAYKDSLYYKIDNWIPVLDQRIASIKVRPQDVDSQLELTKFYYNLGGLYVELTHIMGFNSKYKIEEIEEKSLINTRLAKETARKILDRDDLTIEQQAQAYLYLGASEGSLGVLEFIAGNVVRALINGFKADNHLEKAIELNSKLVDPYLGLGIYRYGNSRIGGLGNFIMQGGRDKRALGLSHIQRVIDSDNITTPLATITLAWFYIAVQINPDNIDLPNGHPLSLVVAGQRVRHFIAILNRLYFSNPPDGSFIGNKGFAMLQAIQFIIDGKFVEAREKFTLILRIIDYLDKEKSYKVNPEQKITINAGIKFTDVMIMGQNIPNNGEKKLEVCQKVYQQIKYMKQGGKVISYEVEKIRDEINEVFLNKIKQLHKTQCDKN